MSTNLKQFRADLSQSWLKAFILIALVPLFPEYISFLLVIPAAILAWQDVRKSGRRLRLGLIGKILLVYIGYMFITTLYSRNFLHSLATVGMWIFFFVVYMMVSNLLTDADRCDSLLLCITAVAGAVGLIACIQYRVGYFTESNPIEVWGWLDKIVFDLLPLRIENPIYILRSCSTFNNPNVLAEYLMTVAPFVVYFNFCERRKDIRVFCRICLLLNLSGVLFSFSRGGYMALIVLCLALIVLNFRRHFAAVSMYLVSAFILVPDEVVKRLISIIPGIKLGGKVINSVADAQQAQQSAAELSKSLPQIISDPVTPTVPATPPTVTTPAEIINNSAADLAINDRLRMWLECLSRFTERPLFGYGAGIQNTWDMLEESGINAVHAHNFILQTLMEGGLVALAIMGWLGFVVIRNGIRLMRNDRTRAFWMGFAIVMFASSFIIHGLVDYPLLTPKLICNFMMILAIIERGLPLYIDKGLPIRRAIARKSPPTAKQPLN